MQQHAECHRPRKSDSLRKARRTVSALSPGCRMIQVFTLPRWGATSPGASPAADHSLPSPSPLRWRGRLSDACGFLRSGVGLGARWPSPLRGLAPLHLVPDRGLMEKRCLVECRSAPRPGWSSAACCALAGGYGSRWRCSSGRPRAAPWRGSPARNARRAPTIASSIGTTPQASSRRSIAMNRRPPQPTSVRTNPSYSTSSRDVSTTSPNCLPSRTWRSLRRSLPRSRRSKDDRCYRGRIRATRDREQSPWWAIGRAASAPS